MQNYVIWYEIFGRTKTAIWEYSRKWKAYSNTGGENVMQIYKTRYSQGNRIQPQCAANGVWEVKLEWVQ